MSDQAKVVEAVSREPAAGAAVGEGQGRDDLVIEVRGLRKSYGGVEAGSQDKLTVSHGAAFASVSLARDENATTFRVHGRGLLVGLIVNEFGIARTVTAAIKEAFGPVPASWPSRTQAGSGPARLPRPRVRGRQAG